jgi:chromosome segregation ATPase
MAENDTEQSETSQTTLGTESASTDATGTEEQSEGTVSKAEIESLKQELERVRKEASSTAQERNLLRNQIKTAEQKALEESGQIEQAYQKLKSDHEALQAQQEADRAQAEAKTFRDKVIAEYTNPKVREVAQKLIDKNPQNLVWTDGATPDEAKTQILDQLNSLAAVIGTSDDSGETTTTTTQGTVNPNNPQVDLGGKRPEDMTLEELQKVLPKADQR